MEYGIEYHVLQEELSSPSPEIKKIKSLEEMNKTLMQQNKILHEQLEVHAFMTMLKKNFFHCCIYYMNILTYSQIETCIHFYVNYL